MWRLYETVSWFRLLFVGVIIWAGSPAVFAQGQGADIVGRITDATGAPIAGAVIEVRQRATGAVRAVHTDASGDYAVLLVTPGVHDVTIGRDGFLTQHFQVALAAGDRLRLDALLTVGPLSELVQVASAVSPRQTDSATHAVLLPEQMIGRVPLNGRNVMRLVQLLPGATEGLPNSLSSGNRPDDRRQTSSVSVNGQTDVVNNHLVDGADNNDRIIGAPIVRPSAEAIAEVRVHTHLYPAELGRTAGAVVNVISRSGTNEWRGSVFEFYRNEAMDARNFFAPPGATPPLRQHQHGASLGGPLQSGRMFVFGAAERFTLRQGVTFVSTVPTARMRLGDFSEVAAPVYDPFTTPRNAFPGNIIPAERIDATAARLLALYPLPTSAGSANNYTAVRPRQQESTAMDVRTDYRYATGHSTFVRYSRHRAAAFVPGVFPAVDGIEPGGQAGGFAGPSDNSADAAAASHLHILANDLLLDSRATYVRASTRSLPLNYGSNASARLRIPGINVDERTSALSQVLVSGYTPLGDAGFLPLETDTRTLQFEASFLRTRGAHTVKFGGGVIDRAFGMRQSSSPVGIFTFTAAPTSNGLSGGHPVASLLLGTPAQVQRSHLLVEPRYHTSEPHLYVQDDWRATSTVTLNAGLRYDVFTPLTESRDQIANFDPATARMLVAGRQGVWRSAGVRTDFSNLAPRFGIAATLPRGLIARGGYGLTFYPGNYAANALLRNHPFVFSYGPVPSGAASGGPPTLLLGDGLPPPVAPQGSSPSGTIIAVDRNFGSTMLHQLHALVDAEIGANTATIGYIGSVGRRVAFVIPNINLAPPGEGLVDPRRAYASRLPGVSTIGLMTSTGESSYHALQLSLTRRYTAGLAFNTHYTWSHARSTAPNVGGGGPPSAFAVVPADLARTERGASDFDVRHRWALVATYDVPAVSGGRSARMLLNGWQLSAAALWQTGSPFTVVNATPRSNTGVGANGDRPNRIGSGRLDHPTIDRWFDADAFVPQPVGTVGNSGRNILYGPPARRLDASVAKTLGVTGRGQLQLRLECFNVTNTPSFGLPNAALGSPGFATISTTGNATPRQFQLGARVSF
jgi:hypothetical protein